MTDLETRLRALHVPTSRPDDDIVLADVRRARVAARRRRATRLASGGVGLLAIGAAAGVVVVSNQQHPSPTAHIASRTPAPDDHAGGLRLVDYAGRQEPGFRVAKVPEGFVLQGATPFSLDVARASDHSDLNVFEGKLVVMLQSKDASLHTSGRRVRVHGTTGYLRTEEGTATTLEYVDGEHVVQIQSWANIDLSVAQLVEFADGVTVTDAARASVG